MEHLFTSLSKRQTMLLLSAVTFGGAGAQQSLEFLPDEESELLRARAKELLAIPREKRIPLLVQELKRLVSARRTQLWAADPARVAEVLRHERPVLVDVLLKAFPQPLADAVRLHLPPMKIRRLREPNAQVLAQVRWKLEEILARTANGQAQFKFSDVLRLQPRELFTLADAVGARALGPAVAGLAEADREVLLAALAPDHRQALQRSVTAANEAGRRLDEKDARETLEPHGLGSANAGVVRSAGVQRLARACLAQGSDFAALLVEKYPGDFGRLVGRWIREERARAVNRGDGGRAEFVHELDRLEALGQVTKPVRLPAAQKVEPDGGAAQGREEPARGASSESARRSGRGGRDEAARGGRSEPARGAGHRGRDEVAGGGRSEPVRGAGQGGRREPERGRTADPVLRAPPLPTPAPPKARDWMAERVARKVEAQRADASRRDPIAERHARHAGVRSSREVPVAPSLKPKTAPTNPRPSPAKRAVEDAPGTHAARPPRHKR